jgi:hypothetical protein
VAESKYKKYFIPAARKPPTKEMVAQMKGMKREGTGIFIAIKRLFSEANVSMGAAYYTKPFTMVPEKHVHKYDDYLLFFGTNTKDWNDFDAEWELYMGEEGERCIISQPTIVYIPAGVYHCPLSLIRADKPVFMMHLMDHSVE